jgi:hypothetical protein
MYALLSALDREVLHGSSVSNFLLEGHGYGRAPERGTRSVRLQLPDLPGTGKAFEHLASCFTPNARASVPSHYEELCHVMWWARTDERESSETPVDADEEWMSIGFRPVVIKVSISEHPVRVYVPAHVLRIVLDVELQQTSQHDLVAIRNRLDVDHHGAQIALMAV